MKYLKISIYLFAIVLMLGACETKKDSEGISKITYFPEFTVNGDLTVYVPSNSEYVDAGASAEENGVSIPVTTTNTVDVTTPGQYVVVYSATNSDGFEGTATREVTVYDANVNEGLTGVEGDYSADVDRNDGGEAYIGLSVTLSKSTDIPGVYLTSDWIGGFYAQGRAYGAAYGFVGLMQINASNEIIELSMSNPWGDPFDYVEGTYDPGTGEIAYDAYWLDGTYKFAVTLTK